MIYRCAISGHRRHAAQCQCTISAGTPAAPLMGSTGPLASSDRSAAFVQVRQVFLPKASGIPSKYAKINSNSGVRSGAVARFIGTPLQGVVAPTNEQITKTQPFVTVGAITRANTPVEGIVPKLSVHVGAPA